MIEFKSTNVYNDGQTTIYAVPNNKERKKVGTRKDFEDLYPKVKIDGREYETLKIESPAISYVGKGQPIAIMVK